MLLDQQIGKRRFSESLYKNDYRHIIWCYKGARSLGQDSVSAQVLHQSNHAVLPLSMSALDLRLLRVSEVFTTHSTNIL